VVFRRDQSETRLRLTIPASTTTLHVGTLRDMVRLEVTAAKLPEIAPGAASPMVKITQAGARRAVEGSFVPRCTRVRRLIASVTVDTMK